HFGEDQAHPDAAQLREAFRRFGDSFMLSEIKLANLSPQSRGSQEAVFDLALAYHSRHFPPLEIETELVLKRSSIFAPWRIVWKDNLSLPASGVEASYELSRLEPRRAEIRDRNGNLLAGEGSAVAVGVQPDRISDPERLLQALQQELGLDPDYVRGQYERTDIQGHWFLPLVKLAEEEYLEVESLLRPIPGIFFRRETSRAYPFADSCAHLTGYLGEVTGELMEAYPQRDYQSGEAVGRSGLEASRDDFLRGRPGYRFYAQPSGGERVLISEKPVRLGADLNLTIDGKMQDLAFKILEGRMGALAVLEADSGAVLALASAPSFDPNEFSLGIGSRRWQELSTDLKKPLFNRALQGLYPPGSVFKVVTAAAALDQGLYEAGSVFTDTGRLRVEGNIIRNFQEEVFGEHTLHTALVQSINTTWAQVGLDLGAPLLEEYFRRWNLDQSWPLGLAMREGQLGSPGRSKVGLAWSAVGQDQVLLTPLHLAQVFSVFANQGRLAPLHLWEQEELGEEKVVIKPETAAVINAMLRDAVLSGTGTQARVPGLEIYGKTGTAEAVGGGVHAWFAGHTQLPSGLNLAFALLVEEGGIGGQTAAPLIAAFLSELIR
ncbi:MAG: hypothetical protein GX335_01485, partial [Firmicutes bacterium]|nr:hypothetical protein [Bacillota bacterium]